MNNRFFLAATSLLLTCLPAPWAHADSPDAPAARPFAQLGTEADKQGAQADNSNMSAAAGKPQQLTSPDQTPEGLEKSAWASIRAAHTAWEHSFVPLSGQDGHWQARNPGQQWTVQFDGRGFMTKPKAAEWQWGLELRSYGFGNTQQAVKGQPEVKAGGQRLSYQWDALMQEWFVNDQRGLEHGFILAQRPEGAVEGAALDVVLGTRGTLKASVAADAQTVYFRDKAGAPIVNYTGLKVWDADGQVLPSRFVSGPEDGIVLRVEEGAARYPITIDPIAQQAFLKAGNNAPPSADVFGTSVAVSGNTVVVGAPGEDSSTTGVNSTPNDSARNAGAVYIFVRDGTNWTQQAYLKASNAGADDFFGGSVAVADDTVIVGANGEDSSTTGVNSISNNGASDSGAAYVFVRSGTSWNQQAYMKASNTGLNDQFGDSVAVSGDTVVIGASLEDSSTTGVNSTSNDSASESGAAYVFVRSGTSWSQQAFLKPAAVGASQAGDLFGYSVSVSDDTVLVGAPLEDGSATGVNNSPNDGRTDSGAAFVFTRSGTNWSQQAYLKASNAGADDQFGRCVAVSGNTVIVGAVDEDSSSTGVNSSPNDGAFGSGAAYVFVRSGTSWSLQAYLKPSAVGTTQDYDSFGSSVAISGDTVVVGAPGEFSSTTGVNSTPNEAAFDAGAAYVFVRIGTNWSQQAYLKASNTAGRDSFAYSVGVSGDIVIAGALGEDSSTTGVNSTPNEGASSAGAAYIYVRSGTNWSQESYLKSNNTPVGSGESDYFGNSVAVSGDTVVVGAYGEDSGSTGVNSTPDEGADASGAAYVFVRSGTIWSQQAYLKATNTGENDNFGRSVAVSGDTLVVGAPLEDSSTTGVNSISNNGASDSGAAYVFVRSGTSWSQQAYLKPAIVGTSQESDFFGGSVAVSGDTVVVGAAGEDSSTTGVNSTPNEVALSSGAAYVFARNGTTWSQQAYLKPAAVGTSQSGDAFGTSVAVSDSTVVVGAYAEDSSTTGINSTPNESASGSGAAYVFVRSGTNWSQQAYLKPAAVGTSQVSDFFGGSVAVSGDTVVAGASGEDSSTTGVNSTPNESAPSAGAAYVFVRNVTSWSQQAYLKASNTGANDLFGCSTAVEADTVIVGAYGEDSSTTGVNSTPNNSASNAGATYVFTRSSSTWGQQAYLKASNAGRDDNFGRAVSVSGDTVVAGALGEASSSSGVNASVDELASFSGAAYVFTGLGPVVATTPEIALSGNDQDIFNGDATPTTADHTGFGSVNVTGGSVARTFTITNSGTAALNLTGTSPNYVTLSGSAAFSVTQQPASATVAAEGGTQTFQITFDPASAGIHNAMVSIASGDADENPFTFALAGTGLTPEQVFTSALTAAGLTGDDAEPDASPFDDGVENLLKYAFNMNLSGADSSTLTAGGGAGLPAISQEGSGPAGIFRFEFVRRKNSGLIYTPMTSPDLSPESWEPLTAAPTVTSIDATWERVVVEEPVNLTTTPSSFGQVEVSMPSP